MVVSGGHVPIFPEVKTSICIPLPLRGKCRPERAKG